MFVTQWENHTNNPHIALLVKTELEKILGAKFIRAIDYAKWISNIVPVSKHEKTIRVCTDFQDRSLILIEPTQAVNSGIDEAPEMVHLAQSLSSQEK